MTKQRNRDGLLADSGPRVPVSVLELPSVGLPTPRRGSHAAGNSSAGLASRDSVSHRAKKNTAGRCHLTAFSGNLNLDTKSELSGECNRELLIVFRKLFTDLFPVTPRLFARVGRGEISPVIVRRAPQDRRSGAWNASSILKWRIGAMNPVGTRCGASRPTSRSALPSSWKGACST